MTNKNIPTQSLKDGVSIEPAYIQKEFDGLRAYAPFLFTAHKGPDDISLIEHRVSEYQNAYRHGIEYLQAHPIADDAERMAAALQYKISALGTHDGSVFRLVAAGLLPAARIEVALPPPDEYRQERISLEETSLVTQARPEGLLPHVGHINPYPAAYTTSRYLPGFAYSPNAVAHVAQTHRELFDQLGYPQADPAVLAVCVFQGDPVYGRSPIATNLLLGHSVHSALFGDLVSLYNKPNTKPPQATAHDREALERDAKHILTDPQYELFVALQHNPALIQQAALLEDAVTPEAYTTPSPTNYRLHDIWQKTGMSDFLHRERAHTFEPNEHDPDTRTLWGRCGKLLLDTADAVPRNELWRRRL